MFMPLNARRFKPLQISYSNLGDRRNNPRFWQEGLRLAAAGFEPGTPIRQITVPETGMLIIETTTQDKSTHTVSSRSRPNADPLPIIDINNAELGTAFDEKQLLRVSYYKGKIVAQVHTHDMNRHLGIQDLWANLRAGVISMATVCVGGGITTSAMKEGFRRAGLRAETEWVIDLERKYLQSAMDNTEATDPDTMIVEGLLGNVEVDQLPPVNCLNFTLPCTGASTAGRNRLKNPESHKTAGTTVLKAVEIIEMLMPPIITNENVIPWASTASADLFAGRLLELGYHIDVRECGGEFGTLEDRKRSIMVATHSSLSLDMETLVPVMAREAKIADILEDIPLNDPMWKSYDYLVAKEARDIAAGKGFRRQLLTGEEEKCGVITKGYAKVRSTDYQIQHPTNPKLTRLFTVKEHAALMKIPVESVANLSKTVAHEVLGQSGSRPLFTALGEWIGTKALERLTIRDAYGPGVIKGFLHDQCATAAGKLSEADDLNEFESAANESSQTTENQLDMWSTLNG